MRISTRTRCGSRALVELATVYPGRAVSVREVAAKPLSPPHSVLPAPCHLQRRTTIELDVRGDICPYPMLKTVQALKKLPKDKTLVVITDHAPTLESIPTQARPRGFGVTIEPVGNPEWRITLSPEGEA